MIMDFNQYKLIANTVQLTEVELESLECNRLPGNGTKIILQIERKVDLIDSSTARIFLRSTVKFEANAPCFVAVVYKGICRSYGEIVDEKLREFAFYQVVPLLLPYARECIATNMTKMGLSPFILPTMDVIKSLEVNAEPQDNESTNQE